VLMLYFAVICSPSDGSWLLLRCQLLCTVCVVLLLHRSFAHRVLILQLHTSFACNSGTR
jgi:hypothetical protein